VTSADGTTDYTYDATSQLTGADHSYQTDESYSYDSNGNRTMSGYDTGPNNQLLSDGTYDYEYDDEGNRIRREKISDGSAIEYDWDFRNRLVRVTDYDEYESVTQVVEYTYDVFDRRISRAVDTTDPFDLDDALIERYVLDDRNGVASLDGGNVILDFVDPDGLEGEESLDLARRYLYGNVVDQLFAQENVSESISTAARVNWGLVDHLGTARDIYANDASDVEHYQYESFGRVALVDPSPVRYLYSSREYEPTTGLQLNRARWYDPAVGRFISKDPVSFICTHPTR
jgi:RHS repeat-associated protein